MPSEIVTRNVYAPARANVTVASLAALVPFAENVTGAGGVPRLLQVYVRLLSPPSSFATTVSAVLVLVTGFGVAVAGSTRTGTAPSTLTAASPCTEPLVARTTTLSGDAGES